MAGERKDQVPPGRRHIIKRPRLTRILDESAARVLMLVAPAGYGKTTLAREWLENKRHVWYQGGPASADVAALAVGLADVFGQLVPNAGERMRARLRATKSPEEDVEPLAELLVEDLAAWPDDAWIAVDDYQFLSKSEAAERFIDVLLKTDLNLFVTSRQRPRWASARRLLYGEIHEVGRYLLAMTQEEAGEVLADRGDAEASGILALADGWPAVIGLASLTSAGPIPDDALPASLHEFFADELYQGVRPTTQHALCRLAVAPTITHGLTRSLFGRRAPAIIREGAQVGALTQVNGDVELHPLLRAFLLSRLEETGVSLQDAVTGIVAHYVDSESWDDLFSLAEDFGRPELISQLFRSALLPMLKGSRFATLYRWVSYARREHIEDPVVDLVEAELAFRRGENPQAECMALHAAQGMGASDTLASRAFFVAGEAAHLNHEDAGALRHFAKAHRCATKSEDAWRALWGQVLSAASLHHKRAPELVRRFRALSCNEPDFLLCRATAPGAVGARTGTLDGATEALSAALPLASKARDPLVRLAFLITYTQILSLEARYDKAIEMSDGLVAEAEELRLSFVLPHVYTARAYAELGLRRFRQATAMLDKALNAGAPPNNPHISSNVRSIRARAFLAQGLFANALKTLEEPWDSASEPAMHGEFLATRSLAYACAGLLDQSLAAGSDALRRTTGVEAVVLTRCAEAVVALARKQADREKVAIDAFEAARRSRNFDSLVCSYRAHPPLLAALSSRAEHHPVLSRVLVGARDHALAKTAGLRIAADDGFLVLTPREQEVLGLLARGLTNKEIAIRLFISVSTAKVHVLNILNKLGAHSRTEAALLAVERGLL